MLVIDQLLTCAIPHPSQCSVHAQVLTNLIEVFKLLAGAKAPIPSPGLTLLLSLSPAKGLNTSPNKAPVGDPTAGGSQQAVRKECEATWGCMQSECQALLADVLAAPSLQARADGGMFSLGGQSR